MNPMKKRVMSALCAVLLMFSLTACGGSDAPADDGNSTGADAAPAAPAAMGKDDYLAAVEGLNEAAASFAAASAELISTGLTNADDMDALNASVEKIRETRQPFDDFAAISNPAEGYEDAHTALAKDCSDFSALVNEYCDVLLGALSGESSAQDSDIQSRMESVVTSMETSIQAVMAVG